MKAPLRFFFLAFIVLTLQSNNASSTPTNPRIGTFSLYREITPDMIVAYFGSPSEVNEYTKDDDIGDVADCLSYDYKENNKIIFSFGIFASQFIKRIDGFYIDKRDPKFAINGILMVGDPLSTVERLGYEISSDSYTESQNYIIVSLPVYRVGSYKFYYYLEVFYDENKVIKLINMIENQGV